jgi:hypothetical protein
MKLWRVVSIAAVLACLASNAFGLRTAKFDFDACKPILQAGMSTPFDQACGPARAHFFSSHDGLMGGGYSVQNANTTFYTLHLFSGNYLDPNGLDPGTLNINFNTTLLGIKFDFATSDFQQVEIPTTIQVDAYYNSTLVGSMQTHGTYGSDTMPMGTLTFKASAGKLFNRVVIWIPWQPNGATDVLVDNVYIAK